MKDEALSIVKVELDSLRERIIANLMRAGQNASGRTIASLRVDIRADGGTLFGRSPFGTTETGRKGGKVPANFQDIIKQWIIDKGIAVTSMPYIRAATKNWTPKYTPEQRGLNSMSWCIARKIAREGTALHRAGGREDIYTKEVDLAVKNISDRVFGIFKEDVTRINKRANENI